MKSKFNTPPKLALLLFITLVCFNVGFAQSNVQLYVCVNDLGPQSKAYIQQNNIPEVSIIYTQMIDPRRESKLDSQSFTNAINKYIPDANASGYAVIDWEGKLSADLELKPQDSPEFQNALSEFKKAILLAKKLRPNKKWGFFGVPWQPLDKSDPRPVNTNIPQLLGLCDAFYPQLYVPYNVSRDQGRRSKTEKDSWISFHIMSNLKLAQSMNKPVLTFFWQRYYGRDNSLSLIPLDEFKDYVKEIAATNYNGKTTDGIILWSNDYSFYSTVKTKAVVQEFENSGSNDFRSYDDALILKYMNTAQQTLTSGN